MSRTIVVFHLPVEGLIYLELADLIATPVNGGQVVLDGTAYRISDLTESIGVFDKDGNRRTGLHKLFEILAVTFGNESVNLLKGLRNVGSGDQPEVTPGRIIVPNQQLIGDFDNVVFAKLQPVGASGKRPVDVIGQMLKAVGRSADAAQLSASPRGTSPSAPPIVVGDEAASGGNG